MSSIISEQYEFGVGVDTHAATHTFALVAGVTGAVLEHAVFPTIATGLSRARGWLAGGSEDVKAGMRASSWKDWK